MLIGYSGGPNGGENTVKHLEAVAQTVGLKTEQTAVKIPSAWKAFDSNGTLIDKNLEKSLIAAIKNLMAKV